MARNGKVVQFPRRAEAPRSSFEYKGYWLEPPGARGRGRTSWSIVCYSPEKRSNLRASLGTDDVNVAKELLIAHADAWERAVAAQAKELEVGSKRKRQDPEQVILHDVLEWYEREPITPYSIRHTMARELRAAGFRLDDVGDFLGHKGKKGTTVRYAPDSPEYLKAAASVVDAYMRRLSGEIAKLNPTRSRDETGTIAGRSAGRRSVDQDFWID